MIGERKQKSLEYTKRWLRRHFPSEYPIKITLKKKVTHTDFGKEDLDGLTTFDHKNQRFLIHLSKKLNLESLVLTILHEYAHCLRSHAPENSEYKVHDEVYWAIYGQIYRKWFEE